MVRERVKAPKPGTTYATHQSVANPSRGEVAFIFRDESRIASINFDKAARLIELFKGEEGGSCNFGGQFFQSWLQGDIAKVSAAVAILLDTNTEDVLDASPPYDSCLTLMKSSYNLFFFGSTEAPEEPMEEGEQATDPLANGNGQTRGWFSWLKKPRSKSDYHHPSFGSQPSTKSRSTQGSGRSETSQGTFH